MSYQQMSLEPSQDWTGSIVYRGGSRASRTALREAVKRLVTNVTYGRSSGELLASLSPSGLWRKMYRGYYQAKMDGSLEEFSETFPRWGMMLDGVLIQQQQLEPYIDENGWQLLPTPTASDYKGGCLRKNSKKQMSNLKEHIYMYSQEQTRSIYLNPQFLEQIMGFPIGWTEQRR